MNRTEAEALVVVLDTAWPSGGFLDDAGELTPRGLMYAADLERFPAGVGAAAIESLRHSVRWSQGPTPAELIEALHMARREHAQPVLELPDPAEAPDLDEDSRAILRRYWDTVGVEREATAKLEVAVRRGDREARIEAARLLAARQIASEPPPPRPPRPRGKSSCGVEWGTTLVEVDGEWVCPNCGAPGAEGCRPLEGSA